MPRIPDETLQQILASTDIVDLVGRSVKLRRVGTNWRGLCPFHQEKTPSFYVNPQRGTYHCFGCGVGGNAFRFIMEHNGLTFVEAARRLADAAGVRIEEEVWNEDLEKAARVRKALLKVHADIADWYHHLLMKDPIAEPAREYLKSRGITAQSAKRWKMGYAPAGSDLLRQWAAPFTYTENLLVHAGILARGAEDSARAGESYPRFRHRLMFPIHDDNGTVIAFSGRLLDPEAKAAKYLNSPETPIFSKSKVLFGLDMSKRAIIKANRALICEGQLDLITAFEHGIENVVAPLGTAFTEYHARILRRHADEVVLCFDADAAGQKAAERAFAILAPTGLSVKVSAPFALNEDPDSVIRNQGAEVFMTKLEERKSGGVFDAASRDFFDHMIDIAGKDGRLSEAHGKSKFASEMAALILLLDDFMAKESAIRKVAMALRLPDADYAKQVARAKAAQRQKEAGQTFITGEAKNNTPVVNLSPQDGNASLLCHLALSDPDVLGWLRSQKRTDILDDISGTELLSVVWKSTSDLTNPIKLAAFFSTVSREEESALNLLMLQPKPAGGLVAAHHALLNLELKRIKNLRLRMETEQKQPGLPPEQIGALLSRLQSLRKEYLDLEARAQDIPPLPET